MLFRNIGVTLAFALFVAPALAQNVAYLRTSCTGVSPCFTTPEALSTWLHAYQFPPLPEELQAPKAD